MADAATIKTALTHAGCGGIYEMRSSRGMRWYGYNCSRCGDEIEVDYGDVPSMDFEAWKARQPKYEPPTACVGGSDPDDHFPRPGTDVCFCGRVRFWHGACPTCGQEWFRTEPAVLPP